MKTHTFKIIASLSILLILIIATALYSANILAASSKKLETNISAIEDSTKSGNWEAAKRELMQLHDNWSRTENSWAMIIDHIELDNIDDALSKMSRYIETKDTSSALAEAASLKHYIKHIPEKESFLMKNLF